MRLSETDIAGDQDVGEKRTHRYRDGNIERIDP